jgi:tetratricopeptide (TPR) repeat protein
MRDQASSFMKHEDWTEAAMRWEILQLTNPDNTEYADLQRKCESNARQTASHHIKLAEEASAHGKPDEAMRSYLIALRMDPDNQTALKGLREIEREHAEKVYLDKPKRTYSLSRRNHHNHDQAKPPQPTPYSGSQQQLDIGVMLFRQEDYPASIQALEKYLSENPKDETGRNYLGDAYFQLALQQQAANRREEALANMEKALSLKGHLSPEQNESYRSLRDALVTEYYDKGVRAYYSDIGQAIVYWRRALQFNPNHLPSKTHLRQALKAQNTLKSINRKGTR